MRLLNGAAQRKIDVPRCSRTSPAADRTSFCTQSRNATVSAIAPMLLRLARSCAPAINPAGAGHAWLALQNNKETKMHPIDEGKRRFVRQVCCCGAALGAGLFAGCAYPVTGKKTSLTPEQALALLKEGNQQFLNESPAQTATRGRERRLEIAGGQAPFAVVLSCSDSRVPPELLFSRGLGELFTVRNAGNTVDTAALGSIEYGVAELGVPLVVVLGHERCGAVDAALSVVENNAMFPGSIGGMVQPIVPAVLQARSRLTGKEKPSRDEWLDASVRENVTRVVQRLRTSEPLLIDPLRSKKLMVVGARYDLDDGVVEFFET
jgi:carbonic anhydrase